MKMRMRTLMQAFAVRKGVQLDSLIFYLDGNRVNADHTPTMLQLVDGDEIDVNIPRNSAEGVTLRVITIKVRDQTGEQVHFKIDMKMRMRTLMQAFAVRKGVQLDSLIFYLDGNRVNADHTPTMLQLVDGDEIDVNIPRNSAEGVTLRVITIKVRDQTGEQVHFKIDMKMRMRTLMQAFAVRKGVQLDSLIFYLDGNRVNADHTPTMLQLVDGDEIDVRISLPCC